MELTNWIISRLKNKDGNNMQSPSQREARQSKRAGVATLVLVAGVLLAGCSG